MLSRMQVYSVLFSAAVLWLLASLGSFRPRTTLLVGIALAAVTVLLLKVGNRDEEGEHEPS